MAELYMEYERVRSKYTRLQEQFCKIILEKERLITRTMPSAIRYDKDKVQNTIDGNPLENYVISAEEKGIDDKIARFRTLLDDWKLLLDIKEQELRKSKDIINRVYVCRYLDGFSVNRICRALHYEKSRIYQFLEQISLNIGKNWKNTVL